MTAGVQTLTPVQRAALFVALSHFESSGSKECAASIGSILEMFAASPTAPAQSCGQAMPVAEVWPVTGAGSLDLQGNLGVTLTSASVRGEPCEVYKYSSRVCERGTLSCDVEHSRTAQPVKGGKL